MVNANDFTGKDDSEIINNAVKNSDDGVVVISKRKTDDTRDFWLLDRAISVPENTTIIVRNCKIKLSDRCRDNFFRSGNCGMGIDVPEKISNVHIIGEGFALLEGAENPRATGDSSKPLQLVCPHEKEDIVKYAPWVPDERRSVEKITFDDEHSYSYGSDFGKEGESQYGDWRGIGILFANVENFSIENITLKDYHNWGISLEACTKGRVNNITFDAYMSKTVNGMKMNYENQDGINLRNGCNNIIISNIQGNTGDDVIALTAISTRDEFVPGGSLRTNHVMNNDWKNRDTDIHDVIIKNVVATSHCCYLVRLLPIETHIYNIVIDSIIDKSEEPTHQGTVLIGISSDMYGGNINDECRCDECRYVTISNVVSNAGRHAVAIRGYLWDSTISNVLNKNKNSKTIDIGSEQRIKNVITDGIKRA